MTNILAGSQAELQRIQSLMAQKVPSYRQAYSDRTAWVMACLSELAYIRFNPVALDDKQTEFIQKSLSKLLAKKTHALLLKFFSTFSYDHIEEQKNLEESAGTLEMIVVETFDFHGTQAVLFSFEHFIVLAFRGTEATSIKDIKSDLDAKSTQCETGGKIHTGFKEAFERVALDIQAKLNEPEYKDKPLFITGHSLGGALATVAAKKLSHKGGIAACYTFGSPRVGNDKWIAGVKTPMYRIVNAADCVTMLPPGTEWINSLGWLSGLIPLVGKHISSWLMRFGGYLHAGDMRYLTNCKSGAYDDVKLLYSVSFFFRVKALVVKKLPWKKFLADHSISIYRKKLMVVAENRNPNATESLPTASP